MKKSVSVYKPIPFREGNTILKKYTEDFVDKSGHKAIITKVDYKDKKENVNIGYILYVKWID